MAAGPAGGDALASPGSMDQLRARLAEKLGATPSKDNRFVMRVSNRGESGENVITAVHGGTARAAHRAGKAAAHGAGEPAADAHAAARGGLLPTTWDYAGAAGPDAWGKLGYDTCARGQRQSPIDIRGGIAVDLEPIRFDYRPGAFSVIDDGHTVEVDVAPGSSITITGRRYELQQFHFHRPSEERVDGRQFDMSVHLVHKDAEGRLAVVAVLLDRGSAQPVVQAVWNNLPLEKHEAVRADTPLDPAQLLPDDRRYYTYMGSLTTPPCSEGVLWMVMQHPVPLSPEQLSIFARLYPMNARPIQQADGRLIKQSN
jgi:carbonic anhydrase